MRTRVITAFKIFATSLIFLLTVSSLSGKKLPARVRITILATTDLHGSIDPIDYYTNKPDNRGLAKISTLVARARKENPDALLIDSGDTIQGTPLEYYHNKENNQPPDPMMLAMNALHYDSMTVGNHEYNFGLKVLEKARKEAKFPWLSANTYDIASGKTHYQPYIVKEISGVRVGVLGLTTPGIPNWEDTPNYAGLRFEEPVSEARKWVSILRDKEHVDLVVIAMHMGVEEDLKTGELNPGQVPNENRAIAIAKEVPGIDAIFMGHTHQDIPSLYVNGVLLTQAYYQGRVLARADFYLNKVGDKWKVESSSARTIPADEKVAADPAIMELTAAYDRETQAWLSQPIGESDKELSAAEARFRDTAILDLIQKVQLEAGKADISMAASFNPEAHVPKGQVTVRDIAGLYVYENTLAVIEVTGKQLKDALEHSAKYFGSYIPGRPVVDLVDEKIPGYNFDIAEGVNYDLDISKPIGSRIQNLTFKGKPVRDDQVFRLATNNYRVNGGGGYSMYQPLKLVWHSSEEIRDMIIDWVERNKKIPTEPDNNWKIVP